MSRALQSLKVLAVACLVSGCSIYRDGMVVVGNEGMAREQFAYDNTCPHGRVTAKHAPPEPPPPDVAADPERARMWKAREADASSRTFIVSGCGKEGRYECSAFGGNGEFECWDSAKSDSEN